MAIKKTIEIDVDVVRANGGLENFTQNFKKSEEAAKSLKTQLREAQLEVATLSDKFGATSKEAVEAAKRAAELKDRIGDAKSLTEAFNPDAKFKALSASLSGVAGGFAAYQGAMGLVGVESKDLEKQLLKVQSAMAIAQGFQALGEARDSFKQLKAVAIDAFNGIKKAIGSTGIGLLVVAAGAIYAYWDDIKAAVSGVSEEQKKLNAESKKNLTQEQEKLKAIGNQDEVLKLQGKSEREILKMKIAQTDQTILAAKIDLQRIATTNEQQQKAVELNYKYLKSFIDFISIPQRFIFENAAKGINKVIDLINKIPIPGIKIDAKIDEKFAEQSADYITKLGFDPDKTKAEGKKTVDAAKLYLDELANQSAGFQNQINGIDKQAGAEADKIAEDNAKSLEESRKRSREDDEAIRNEIQQAISDAQDKQSEFLVSAQDAEEQKVKDKYFRLIEYAKQFGIDTKELEIAQDIELNEIRLAAQQKSLENEKANSDAKIKIAEEEAAAKQKALQAYSSGLKTAASLLGESTAAGKAMAVAAATIDTIQSGVSAYKGMVAAVPGPVGIALGAVAAAGSLASGYASVKKILAVKTPGGGGGGASAGAGGGAPAPPPQFNIVGQSSTNQLSQTIANQQNRPIQTYVVGNQVSTQQSLDRNAVATSTFG